MNTITITQHIKGEVQLTLPHFSKSEDETTYVCIKGEGKQGLEGMRIYFLDGNVTMRNFGFGTEELPSNEYEFAAMYGRATAILEQQFNGIEREVQP
jgi:hypothetical protein